MADIAMLGIQVRYVDVDKANASLQALTATGARAERQLGGFTNATRGSTAATVQQIQAHVNASTATERHALNINRMERVMESFTAKIFGVNEVLGVSAAALGNFAAGSMMTVGVLAGLAVLAAAFEHLTEASRKAKEEFDKYIKLLDDLKRKQDLGPAGETGAATRAAATQLQVLREQMKNEAASVRANPSLAQPELQLRSTIAAYVKLQAVVNAGETEVTKIFTEEAKKRTEEEKRQQEERHRIQQYNFERETQLERARGEILMQMARLIAQAMAEAGDAHRQFVASASDISDIWQKQKEDLREILFLVHQWVKGLDDAAAKEKQRREIITGAAVGTLSGFLQATGSPLGGIAAGAISGLAGGGVGIAAGAFQALIPAIMGVASAASQYREHMRQLKLQYDQFTDAIKEQLGLMSALEAKLNAVTRQFAQQRDALGSWTELNAQAIERLRQLGYITQAQIDQLNQLNSLEAQSLTYARADFEAKQQQMSQDLNVRALRAQGLTEEADNLAFVLTQQRELADARKQNMSEELIAFMEHVQAQERLARAMAKVKERIDSLTGTIEGLQTFKNSLLLSGTRSPTELYAEAKRQYDEILAASHGDDVIKAQAASGRLPAAAQAFLDASRAVNASGSGFQSDYAKVVADTQGLIDRFSDLRTIEQLQLDELKKISESMKIFHDGWEKLLPFDPNRPTIDPVVGSLQASVRVLQEGFKQTVDRLDVLTIAVNDGTQTTRRGFDGLAANRQN